MKTFSLLIEQLEVSNEKLLQERLLTNYFQKCSEQDAPWAVALLSGRSPKKSAAAAALLSLSAECSGTPLWLAEESARAAGDEAEAAALMVNLQVSPVSRSLALWMQMLLSISELQSDARSSVIRQAWYEQTTTERVLFTRLLAGSFRSPVLATTLIGPLAARSGAERSLIARRLAGLWKPEEVSFAQLFESASLAVADPSQPKPFYTYSKLPEPQPDLGDAASWRVSRLLGGLQVQIVRRVGETFVWSPAEELLTLKVPELLEEARLLPEGTVLAGELVAYSEGRPQPLRVLEQRLKAKRVTKDIQRRIPIRFFCNDVLEHQGEDLLKTELSLRIVALNELRRVPGIGHALCFEENAALSSWSMLDEFRERATSLGARGVLLRSDSSHCGASAEDKSAFISLPEPLSIDAVLLYAEKSKRTHAGLFDEFTFAVRSGEDLVPVAKLTEGLSEQDLNVLNEWVGAHTVERFGPVRRVTPELIFRISYESVMPSTRHRSGIVLIGARVIKRVEASGLEAVAKLESVRESSKG